MSEGYVIIQAMRRVGLKVEDYLSTKKCLKLAKTQTFYDAKEIFGNAGYYDVRLAKSVHEVVNILKENKPRSNGLGALSFIFDPIAWIFLLIFSCS